MPFRDIVGHRRLLTRVARAITHDTLPPSLLLAGPSGVGKRLAALAMAQALNCLTPVTGEAMVEGVFERDACGTCAACRRIARGVHPDVLAIEPGESGTIRIEQVREVIDRAAYRPFEGRRRAVIIDEADALVIPAQHALLKTLEEPPAASVFLLVSSLPDALLPTVRSRCPRLRFGPLPAADVAAALMQRHGYEEADARAAAADAGGSIGRALALQATDQLAAREAARTLLTHAARGADPTRRIGLARDLTAKKTTPADERNRVGACLRSLASLLRDVELLALDGDRRALVNADLERELAGLAASFERGRATRAFVAVDRALAALDRNASPKIVADWLVLQL
jgi:DNA polymerase III subunit delta'